MNSSDPRSSAHLGDDLADFVLGRLTPFEHRRWMAHLGDCAACREQVALAQSMREDGVHLASTRIVQIGDDASVATAEENAHLESCEQCAAELALMRALELPAELERADAPEASVARRTPAPRRARRSFSTPVALLALAAVLLLLFFPRGEEEGLMRGFSELEPLPVRITRASAPPGSMEEARLLGLEAYRDARWFRAAEQLRAARSLGAGIDAELYLASALLLADRDAEALGALETVLADSMASAGVLDEARWLRLQIALRAEDPASVDRWSAQVAAGEGRRAPQARALRDQLGLDAP